MNNLGRRWESSDVGHEPLPFHTQAPRYTTTELQTVLKWCHETIGPGRYGFDLDDLFGEHTMWIVDLFYPHTEAGLPISPYGHLTRFRFKREQDRTVFVLAWSGDVTP